MNCDLLIISQVLVKVVSKFKFANCKQITAIKLVMSLVVIAGKHCKINTEINIENIPLLLSKSSSKRSNTVIGMMKDKATIFYKLTFIKKVYIIVWTFCLVLQRLCLLRKFCS